MRLTTPTSSSSDYPLATPPVPITGDQVPESIETPEDLERALRLRLRIDAEVKFLDGLKKDLNELLGHWVDEHGAVDVPSGIPGRVIRLKKVAATRPVLDAEALYLQLTPHRRRGLFKVAHVIDMKVLEERMDKDAALREAALANTTVTTNKAAVRVDYVESEEDL